MPSTSLARAGLPTSARDLMLLAAFADTETAEQAWTALQPLDIDTLAFELHALLPIVADRRRRAALLIHDVARIDGIRKRLWSQNVLRARAIAAAATQLTTSGVQPLLTGGAAVLAHVGNWSFRPITEADLAVSQAQAERACETLLDDGWQCELRRHDGFLLDMTAVRFARAGQAVTLRWSADGWPHDGYPHAVFLDVAGTSLAVAPRADVLALTFVDAERLPGYQMARRLADVFLLCGGLDDVRPTIDWTAFIRRVVQRKALPEAAQFLALMENLDCPVPQDVVDEVRELAAARRVNRIPVKGWVAASYARRARGQGWRSTVFGIPGYLREVWDLESAWKLPSTFAVRLGRRLGR